MSASLKSVFKREAPLDKVFWWYGVLGCIIAVIVNYVNGISVIPDFSGEPTVPRIDLLVHFITIIYWILAPIFILLNLKNTDSVPFKVIAALTSLAWFTLVVHDVLIPMINSWGGA